MAYRSWLGSARTLRAAALLTLVSFASVTGCKKKETVDAKAEAAKAEAAKKIKQGDRYKDGQRLAAAQKEWQKRWAATADLPECDPLLKEKADLELCKTAATALTTLKAAVAKADPPEPEAVVLHAAAELAYATEAASEKLRNASMEKIAKAEAASAPGASGKPATAGAPSAKKLPALAASAKLKAVGSAAAAAAVEQLREGGMDPSMVVMQAYSRVNRATLRYLSQFLQLGPLPTRKATFTELEALAKRKDTWPALSREGRERPGPAKPAQDASAEALASHDADACGRAFRLADGSSSGFETLGFLIFLRTSRGAPRVLVDLNRGRRSASPSFRGPPLTCGS